MSLQDEKTGTCCCCCCCSCRCCGEEACGPGPMVSILRRLADLLEKCCSGTDAR